ncbi:hypothetical protein LOAG_11949 [Loa loa]|uniref:Uncharacterized protein n=1 Tax=Loa loa TaxID=7209 RepID=A0A1I7VCB8_LOALO|nr:hypothetical protein LOAG_11949 [Loa loa]EFO16557.1 hypothetical protein LOAG_11949 [Loa loa]
MRTIQLIPTILLLLLSPIDAQFFGGCGGYGMLGCGGYGYGYGYSYGNYGGIGGYGNYGGLGGYGLYGTGINGFGIGCCGFSSFYG